MLNSCKPVWFQLMRADLDTDLFEMNKMFWELDLNIMHICPFRTAVQDSENICIPKYDVLITLLTY